MNTDLILVIGIVLMVFSVPSIVSAFSEGRAPRVAAVVLIAAGCLVVYAIQQTPGEFRVEEIPNAFVRVVASIIR
ncbi:hypothetical protein G5B38_14200 [Pseudohalocynthiibacter aestuariivivens]|uniref:50S ribosomal protein L35 n=1 Tax=Roseovarius pelagicus TaxID=2980108 RepID=A0ABY6DGC3_9RHOB|nr:MULTISPECIES: hypothetical protein [Rhodobacterales]QIE46579.1 hypothetical protein G5B38_14200 [Pseudohalocynthiibacter aestuariivivens]UXX84894.1 hypothetical protein N7U68_09740 [Roseovarius pelagicus]